MKISKFILLFFYILSGCKEIKKPKININNVIINAQIIPFDSLTEHQKFSIDYCRYYPNNNWRDIKEYNKKDSYFIKIKIDYQLLADISNYDFKYEETQGRTNPLLLYGKYHNRWILYDEKNALIEDSSKSDGHKIFEFKRDLDFDNIIIGPIHRKPKKLILKIVVNDYKYEENPSINL